MLVGTIGLAFIFVGLGVVLCNEIFNLFSFICSGAFVFELLALIVYLIVESPFAATDESSATEKAKKYADNIVSWLFDYGASNDTYTLVTDKEKKIPKQIHNLLVFGYLIDKNQEADDIVNSFTHLPAFKKALVQAYVADVLDDATTKEIKNEYKRELLQIRDQLYKLCAGDIDKLIFELLKHDQFDYLPKGLQKKYVKDYNNKLLDDLKQDRDMD